MQLLKETKNETNKIKTSGTTATKVSFKNGNTYEYVAADKSIYLNTNIKVAGNIESCKFEVKEIKAPSVRVRDKNVEYTDHDGSKVTIPAGYALSGVASEQLVESGLIIYKNLQATRQRLIVTAKVNGVERVTEYVLSNDGEVDWTNAEEVASVKTTYERYLWIKDLTGTTLNSNDIYVCKNKGTGTYGTGDCKVSVSNGKVTCTVHGNCTEILARYRKQ